MLNTKDLVRRANKLWSSPTVSRELNEINKRKWIRAVQRLGDRWLLAKNVPRLEVPRA